MKAITYHRYGGPEVVALEDIAKPVPKADEVLIRIHATSVTSGDWRARSLKLPGGFGLFGRPVFGFFAPRQPVLGTELSGTIEATGSAVTRFRSGDAVFAFTGASFGCHAEYRTMKAEGLIAAKPANLNFEEAASISFGATTALSLLRDKARVQRGETILVVGASGAVGSAAVQIAHHLGAEVTGVTSTGNLDLVHSLGARDVIDYRQTDFAKTGRSWDVIFDTTGTIDYARCEDALKPGGRLVIVQGTLADAIGLTRPPRTSGKHVIAGIPGITRSDIEALGEMATMGALKPVIDRSYPLESAAEAHAYVDTGRKRGSVVLRVAC